MNIIIPTFPPKQPISHFQLTEILLHYAEQTRFQDSHTPLVRFEAFPIMRPAPMKLVREELIHSHGISEKFMLDKDGYLFYQDRILPRFFFDMEKKITFMAVLFTKWAEGPPKMAHGGAVGTAVDVAVGHNVWVNFGSYMTKTLHIAYEKPIPLNVPVVIRAWVAKQERDITLEYDIVSGSTLTGLVRHCHGDCVYAPMPPDRSFLLSEPTLTTTKATSDFFVSALEAWEKTTIVQFHVGGEDDVPSELEPFPISFDLTNIRYQCPQQVNIVADFGPWVVNPVTRAWVGLHVGRQFDFVDSGTTRIQIFIEPKLERKIIGVVWFSEYAVGPMTVHGGALFAAFDSFMADVLFRIFGARGMTASLRLRYRKSVPLREVCIFSNVEWEVKGKTVYMRCRIMDPAQVNTDDEITGKTIYAEAFGIFILLKPPPFKVGVYWDLVERIKKKKRVLGTL